MAVHSERIQKFLSGRDNITDLSHKFVYLRACTDLRPNYVKPFNDRNIDIIFLKNMLIQIGGNKEMNYLIF